ncbi:MAG: ABC transporter ATP-binding protein [Bacteroidota bacterium]
MTLKIRDLSKTYANGRNGKVHALRRINLTIDKGMFGLLGQNGAGKSTLMRTIATLQNADEGTIHFNRVDVFKTPDALRQVLGYLPQEFGVYPNVSAEELLLHVARMKGIKSKQERKEVVHQLLHRVNLFEVRKNRLDGYSGGMKQRFGIAQALIGNPEIIIVDEPTAGLDPMERNRFYNLLAELGEDAVVLLSTHIVEDVSTLCQEMAIIGNGEVILTGKPEDIENELQGKVFEVPVTKEESIEFKEKYKVISQRFYAGRMMLTIISDELPDGRFSGRTATLEDVYFNLLSDHQETLL